MEEERYGQIPDLDWLNVNDIVVDYRYQRTTESRRSKDNIKRIKKNFRWAAFTPLTVTDIEKGQFAVIDGQHRLQAVKELGDIDEVPCWIIPHAELEQQAADFLDINRNKVAVTPYSMFKAQIASGDKHAIAVNNFLKKQSIEVPANGYCAQPNHTLAIACIKIHLQKHNDVYLAESIACIRKAYPDKTGMIKRDLLNTLIDFKIKNGAKAKDDIIIKTLQAFDNADRITGKADELRALDTTLNHAKAHYRIFINKYKETQKS